MEIMATVFGILGVIAFMRSFETSAKVKKLERMMKDFGIIDFEKESLKGILAKNLGKTAKLEMESEGENFDLANQDCLLMDIDEDWLLVKSVKKEQEGMIRVELVKGVQFI